MAMIRVPLRDRARGRWHGILPALGIDQKYLTGKNGPCPLCPGGRDRWRFLNTDGNGTWICTHCGAGSGIDLVMQFTRAPFREVAELIEAIIGDTGTDISEPKRRSEANIRAALDSLWRAAHPVQHGDPIDLWLQSRGVGLTDYPRCLRTGRSVAYCDGSAVMSRHPAMLAMVTSPDGKPATIHRTYLTDDGRKAPLDPPRKLYSAMPKGSAVRLALPEDILGIAEGIETALAANKLLNVPTWAAISAGMLKNFEPPAQIKTLVIFGDNDSNHVGQTAAYGLAARLSATLAVEVQFPELIDTDWNDVLIAVEASRQRAEHHVGRTT
jgi:putative DNA primase/helicase